MPRLAIVADQVRLEVGSAARVPDSEVVGDRLKLLAAGDRRAPHRGGRNA